ncbi:hypothetical protein EQH57_0448 [Dictyocoela roeselum]|nr:hypothetical protein EQH57_0448 [Dictyocoela roeselum]
MMKVIFKFKYPERDHVKYLNQLSNIKQNNFLRIRDYRDELINTIKKLSICLNWSQKMEEAKIKEAFYCGLSRRIQLEMTRLNVQYINNMFKLIDATETTLIEQGSETARTMPCKVNKDTANYRSKSDQNKSYCDYHHTKNHDLSNCRALKRQGTKSYTKEERNDPKNNFITEPKREPKLIEIPVRINNKTYKFLLDTGSALSYIDEDLVKDNNIATYDTPKSSAILIDGSIIDSSKEAELTFHIEADKSILYKTKVRVLKNMSLNGILGMNFLLENDAQINLLDNILTLDSKHYELKISRPNDQFDNQIIKKTRINASISNETRHKANEQIRSFKLKNKTIGEIKNTSHAINLTENKIVNIPPISNKSEVNVKG